MNSVRGLLRQLLFGVTPKGGIPEQVDPSKPLCIAAGRDSLHGIGVPQGREAGGDAMWRDLAAQLFPDVNQETSQWFLNAICEDLVRSLCAGFVCSFAP